MKCLIIHCKGVNLFKTMTQTSTLIFLYLLTTLKGTIKQFRSNIQLIFIEQHHVQSIVLGIIEDTRENNTPRNQLILLCREILLEGSKGGKKRRDLQDKNLKVLDFSLNHTPLNKICHLLFITFTLATFLCLSKLSYTHLPQ